MINVNTDYYETSRGTFGLRTLNLSMNGFLVDFKFIPKTTDDPNNRYFSYFIKNAPIKTGYTLVGAFNGGAYYDRNTDIFEGPYGSLQIRNNSGVMEEKGDTHQYGDGTFGIGIVDGKIKSDFIYGLNAFGDSLTNAKVIRTTYGFSINKETDGRYTVQYSNEERVNAETADSHQISKNEEAWALWDSNAKFGYRMGIGFKGNSAYMIKTTEEVYGDDLLETIKEAKFDRYINLDGGLSSAVWANGEYVSNPSILRNLHEVFYLYIKNETTDPEEPTTPTDPEEPETPVAHQTMRLTMTVPTISPNRYPTRPSVNGTYNPSTYFINTDDVVVISDIKAASDGNVVCQIADCLTDGVSSSVLNGRWFVYDKDNFE